MINEALDAFFIVLSNGGDGTEVFFGILSLFVASYIVVFLLDPVIE